MTPVEFKFQPQDVKISSQEILADLNYPVPVRRRENGAQPDPRQKARA